MRVIAKFLHWLADRRDQRARSRHLEAIKSLSPLDQYELAILDAALSEGLNMRELRERAGHLAPPHEFSPDFDLRCSICRRSDLGHLR